MNLNKKRKLVARALDIGKNRIFFNPNALSEIKEAITKQDVKDLVKTGSIIIKPIIGTRKIIKRKTRRREGSIKKKKYAKKREYIILTRKLRLYLSALRRRGLMSNEKFNLFRKQIKTGAFRSLSHLKEGLAQNV